MAKEFGGGTRVLEGDSVACPVFNVGATGDSERPWVECVRVGELAADPGNTSKERGTNTR